MLLLWNKANLISPPIISQTFQTKLSQWCLTGQLKMRHAKKQQRTKQNLHVRGKVNATTSLPCQDSNVSASRVTEETRTSMIVAKVLLHTLYIYVLILLMIIVTMGFLIIFSTWFVDINECELSSLNNCTRAENCVNTEEKMVKVVLKIPYHCFRLS